MNIKKKPTKKNSDKLRKIKVMVYEPIPNVFPDKYLWKIWKLIEKTGNFDADYIRIHFPSSEGNTRLNKMIDHFKKSDANILVGDYFITSSNGKYVNYTRSLLYQRPIIVYKIDGLNTNLQYGIYNIKEVLESIKKSLKLMAIPLLFFICIGSILGILIYFSNRKQTIQWAFMETYGSLLGAQDVIVDRSNPYKYKNFIITILVLLVSFLFTIYLTARLTASEIKHDVNKDPFIDSIKNKKIAVSGDIAHKDIQRRGGIPIWYPTGYTNMRLIHKFLKSNEDGLVLYPESINKTTLQNILNKHKTLSISDYKMTVERVAFVMKKHNCHLYEKVNDIITSLHDNQKIFDICTIEYPELKEACQKNFML